MPSQLLRRVSKYQLMAALRRQKAAPFHFILWDNRPIRLADALGQLEREPEDSIYYATPEQVFSAAASRS